MLRVKTPTYCFGHSIRQVTLILSIIGLLAFDAGALSTAAHAGQEEDLRASLSELLFKAVTANDINAVRTVVEAGADLSRVNMNGQTAMDIAVDRSLFEIAQYLVFARRIEQQTTLNTAPTVTTVQQASPEAAPQIVADKKTQPQTEPQLVKAAPQKLIFKPAVIGKQPTY